MIQCRRIVLLVCLAGTTALLNSCFDDSRPAAPVVNAWYQPNAASKFYVVRSDDTIYSIAFAFGLDYRELAAVNHLSPPYPITPGQRLIMTHKPPALIETQNLVSVRLKPIEPIEPIETQNEPQVRVSPPAVQSKPIEESWVSQPPQPVEKPVPEPYFSAKSAWHWPAKGRLMQYFSRNPDGHPGISIAGRLGEPVRATATGTVVYSGDGVRGYGNLIIIKHNDSYLSAYAFNQHNSVTVGEHVQAGSVIARMGQNDAGRTIVYFEIRRNGVPVNPLRFLK
ncbi:MAG: hypothetical protein A3F13_07910 [Gammaproteobacteria bacterium RIFCSPHIGHO2_12_FULL_40_19]|nr:MAG: hypothetical protein A3F13_07910 [Gammaproteobacteria bacterium RIFCSPHIGHO2_12_FULL_40_19]